MAARVITSSELVEQLETSAEVDKLLSIASPEVRTQLARVPKGVKYSEGVVVPSVEAIKNTVLDINRDKLEKVAIAACNALQPANLTVC